MAGTVTLGVTDVDTSNVTSYLTGSFATAANDLLVVFVVATATVAAGGCSDNGGGTYTKITSSTKNASADTLYLFVANQLDPGSATRTVTFTSTGDAATGAVIIVLRVAGMSKTGTAAVRQTAVQNNQASGTTPAPAFAASVLTGNPTVGFVGNATNPATMTPPAGWTEQGDVGYATPTTGGEGVSRDSGFSGTTITWGGTSGSAFGDIVAELDATILVNKSQTLTLGSAAARTTTKPLNQPLSLGLSVTAIKPGGLNVVQPFTAGFVLSKTLTKAQVQSVSFGFLFPRVVARAQPLSLGFPRTSVVTKADSQSFSFGFAPSKSTSKRLSQSLSYGFAVTAVIPAAPGLVSRVQPLVVGFALTLTGPIGTQGGYFWGANAPIAAAEGTVWMDTSVTPPILKKRYLGAWTTIG